MLAKTYLFVFFVQRQIDLVTLIQLYCDALQQLLATTHFDSGAASFDITSDTDSDVAIDMGALSASVAAVQLFLAPGAATGAAAVSEAIGETNLLELLIGLPQVIQASIELLINCQQLLTFSFCLPTGLAHCAHGCAGQHHGCIGCADAQRAALCRATASGWTH